VAVDSRETFAVLHEAGVGVNGLEELIMLPDGASHFRLLV
jgi:hypothetical protein